MRGTRWIYLRGVRKISKRRSTSFLPKLRRLGRVYLPSGKFAANIAYSLFSEIISEISAGRVQSATWSMTALQYGGPAKMADRRWPLKMADRRVPVKMADRRYGHVVIETRRLTCVNEENAKNNLSRRLPYRWGSWAPLILSLLLGWRLQRMLV